MRNDVIMVTGGAGFIGSALVRHLIAMDDMDVVNVDALTYAANPANLADVADQARYRFERVDIRRPDEVMRALDMHRPDAIVHLAAETHVDRSVDDPMVFVDTNVMGTATLLAAATRYWRALPAPAQARFRFLHVSTDEVYGSLDAGGAVTETSAYRPNSPYAATKAGADHLVRAWQRTYGLPTLVSASCNNFGPYQHPEKLIPLLIINALAGHPLPIYGQGKNVRDWLFVEDHARALIVILRGGRVGEHYNVSAGNERRNVDVATAICDLIDRIAPPLRTGTPRRGLITFVADRPGHDQRYALDAEKLGAELAWRAHVSFEEGLSRTVDWYLANEAWWSPLRQATVRRLGLGGAA